ncbi:MAG: hypothetical protein ACI9U0_001659 [Flavobacteriales bacterium]|jgi:hypothetical protein
MKYLSIIIFSLLSFSAISGSSIPCEYLYPFDDGNYNPIDCTVEILCKSKPPRLGLNKERFVQFKHTKTGEILYECFESRYRSVALVVFDINCGEIWRKKI